MEPEKEIRHEGKMLQKAAKLSPLGIKGLIEKMGKSKTTVYYWFDQEELPQEIKKNTAQILGTTVERLYYESTNKETGRDIRNRKAFGSKEDEGIIFVPIAAQAGYAVAYEDPVFISELERFNIPGLPFKGDNFRMFQVDGDSMEYYDKEGRPDGLMKGIYIIAELVPKEHWNFTSQWYIHVIVTEKRIMVKRLFRKPNNEEFVLISDNPNEEEYPQILLHKKDIKELWLLKRKLDWDMPPPREYEVKV